MKTSQLARQRNRRVKSGIRVALKDFQADQEKSLDKVNAMAKVLDKAAAKNVIHKNKAARLKSRLAKQAAKKAN
jgi:small subunit ribosomal protein S20